MTFRRVMVIGLDGLEPSLAETMMRAGGLPNLARLRDSGGYARLGTTVPAQTPVAWSSFAVGANPGAHGIFDFLTRDPATYRPDVGLFHYEQKSRFLPPKAVNLRGGTPVWTWLSDAGVESAVIRHPCTYPPDSPRGTMLAGVGVPDVRGGFGSPSFFTEEKGATAREGEHVEVLELPDDGRVRIHLRGPRGGRGEDATVELVVSAPGADGLVSVTDGSGDGVHLTPGTWSDWLPVRFRLGALQSVHGLVRFHLVSARPLRLYASPVHFDPDQPLFPISHPWDHASTLRRRLGTYHTLGMAEEHTGLNNGRISEEAFLAQCDDVVQERRAMLHDALGRLDQGFLYCLFDTPDRIQHMFWRFRDPSHPANGGEVPPPELARVVEEHYRTCDALVGEVLEQVGDDTLVMVASDHGFTDFRRQVHLNRWLHDAGYLALKPGYEPGDGAGDLLENVDWTRTRAYGVGLAGLFLNVRGREAEGIVDPSDADALKDELGSRLSGLRDPDDGSVAVRWARSRETTFTGPFVDRAPDVVLACAPGYRISSASAMGGVPGALVEDNRERWSGDHVVDPAAVPGVLFMSHGFAGGRSGSGPLAPVDAPSAGSATGAPSAGSGTDAPSITDLAPTILAALGVPGGDTMEGGSLLP